MPAAMPLASCTRPPAASLLSRPPLHRPLLTRHREFDFVRAQAAAGRLAKLAAELGSTVGRMTGQYDWLGSAGQYGWWGIACLALQARAALLGEHSMWAVCGQHGSSTAQHKAWAAQHSAAQRGSAQQSSSA